VASKWDCVNAFCAVTLESPEVGHHICTKLGIDQRLQECHKGIGKANIPISFEMDGLISMAKSSGNLSKQTKNKPG